jgi:hypothetical protein
MSKRVRENVLFLCREWIYRHSLCCIERRVNGRTKNNKSVSKRVKGRIECAFVCKRMYRTSQRKLALQSCDSLFSFINDAMDRPVFFSDISFFRRQITSKISSLHAPLPSILFTLFIIFSFFSFCFVIFFCSLFLFYCLFSLFLFHRHFFGGRRR